MEHLFQLRRNDAAAPRLRSLRVLPRATHCAKGTELVARMPKIAVDAMGGDRAPAVVVEGAWLAAKDLGVELVLVGDKQAIERELGQLKAGPLAIASASQAVEMHESASSALKKKDSSMKIAFDLMK